MDAAREKILHRWACKCVKQDGVLHLTTARLVHMPSADGVPAVVVPLEEVTAVQLNPNKGSNPSCVRVQKADSKFVTFELTDPARRWADQEQVRAAVEKARAAPDVSAGAARVKLLNADPTLAASYADLVDGGALTAEEFWASGVLGLAIRRESAEAPAAATKEPGNEPAGEHPAVNLEQEAARREKPEELKSG